MVAAEFFLQLLSIGYFMLFNFVALGYGYEDHEIAQLISYRFMAVMVLALPLGFLIRGRRLLPLFRVAGLLVPLMSVLLLWSLPRQQHTLTALAMGGLGAAVAAVQVGFIPFIMRNEHLDHQPEAIALHFTSWSATSFFLGTGIFLVNTFRGAKLSEEAILWFLTILSLVGASLFFKVRGEVIPTHEETLAPASASRGRPGYDWSRIVQALIPSLIIGMGAGLTIPFVSLFFHHIFGMEYDQFSLMLALSTLLVSGASMYGPRLLRRYGYGVSITLVQSVAVIALVMMAITENFALSPIAFGAAIGFFLVRQPLMNMANPLLSDFTMKYVGPRNQEITSSLTQALWAGSWFFSTQIFKWLRAEGYSFQFVFLITAVIYVLGISWYAALIHGHQRRQWRWSQAGC
jgi:hypothetical protein